MTRALWSLALVAGLFWPGHVLSTFDGLPLNGSAEAVVLGVAIPFLWVVHRRFLDARWVRVAVLVLVALKVGGSMLTQQGLCARFSTVAPYSTNVLTIPIEEPRGLLRSWDVRADWRADVPACTAIVDRSYDTAFAFPAWFVNITDFASGGRRDLMMDVSGFARVGERGRFSIDLGRDMLVTGRIGSQDVSSEPGEPLAAALDAGVHHIELHAKLTGDRWRFVPRWNDRDAFAATALTVAEPLGIDRVTGGVLGLVAASLVVLLVVAWTLSLAFEYRGSPWLLTWCVVAACVLATLGTTAKLERLSGLLLLAAVFVPIAGPHRNLRGVLLLVGVPWLALFVARSLPQVGHFSAYSSDDWLAYQVAGYRIFMNGFLLEGGSKAFDYQPLYRWMSGLLHLLFGDSSVGEVYWDAICLLLGALVSFALVKPVAGFRWATAAAAATLATFTLGTIWYFVGRGLSEVAAAGWAFLSALLLLHARPAGVAVACAAGVLAVLMFYTRLNHLLFGGCLLVLMIPVEVAARWRDAIGALARVNVRAVMGYVATFVVGIAMFATRTWWYTGVFSVLYGTSLKNNDTGLRFTTVWSPDVWARISHSLRALVWMNEPPSPDPRSILVVAGVVLSVFALIQVPRFNRLPFSIAVVTLGACASSLLAHAHGYPGRMSIHLAPFAIAMTVNAGAKVLER